MDIDTFEPLFTQADVQHVTGIARGTLQNWLNRGVISVTPQHAGGKGFRRLFSVYDIIGIATVMHLVDLNTPPSTANEIIASENFRDWVKLCLDAGTQDKVLYHSAILYKKNTKFFVDYIADENGLSVFRRDNENLSKSLKVFVVIRLTDIVEHVCQSCRQLVMEEARPEELSTSEKAVLAMRQWAERKDND